jgi:isoquinoline 1-oxidoreductase subunit alpha
MRYILNINGDSHEVEVDGQMPLLWVLRDRLELKGSKFGCGMGLCGACTVHINGRPMRSCIVPVQTVGAAGVTTIEGIGASEVGKKLQQVWLETDVMQCGYCQAGQIMTAAALLSTTPKPTDNDIDTAMSGNLCRCATYTRIRAAVKRAADLPDADARFKK